MSDVAIISGTGLTMALERQFTIIRRDTVHTPYGDMSSPIVYVDYYGKSVMLLARHGISHTIPPHKINYRANLWGLKNFGAKTIIAIASVGGIHPDMQTGDLVIPHQLIDYTYSREHTFFADNLNQVQHIDFSEPYCPLLRQHLVTAAKHVTCQIHLQGVYGATQGPRLETIAEINRMEKEGCDIVGMTGMPEAVLARELELSYATCAVVANRAAGRGGAAQITLVEIEANMAISIQHVHQLLSKTISLI